jgi:pimeloyl-ACP methyl ester carboxylesterase
MSKASTHTYVEDHVAVFEYGHKKIPFHFWSHTDGGPVDTVIFMGSAQVGKIPKWVAQAAPAGTVVVDGMPHWHPRPTADDLGRFTQEYSVAAFEAVLKYFGLSTVNIIGLSQATIGVVWLAKTLPASIRSVAIVAPLGLNANALGATPEARLGELKKRTLRTYLQFSQTPFHDPRILYMQFVLLCSLLSESEKGATNKKYSLGLSYDLLEDCRAVAADRQHHGFDFKVFLAQNDKLFPPHEIRTALQCAQVQHVSIVVLPDISHPSLASRSNRKALVQIVNDIRQTSR